MHLRVCELIPKNASVRLDMSAVKMICRLQLVQHLKQRTESNTDVFIWTSCPYALGNIEHRKSIAVNSGALMEMVCQQVTSGPCQCCGFSFSNVLLCGAHPLRIQWIIDNGSTVPINQVRHAVLFFHR